MNQQPKFKVGDFVKCTCREHCKVRGKIISVSFDFGAFEYNLDYSEDMIVEEHLIVLDQEYLNEQKLKKALGLNNE